MRLLLLLAAVVAFAFGAAVPQHDMKVVAKSPASPLLVSEVLASSADAKVRIELVLCVWEHAGCTGKGWCIKPSKHDGQSMATSKCGNMPAWGYSAISFYRFQNGAKPFQVVFYDQKDCKGNSKWWPFFVHTINDLTKYGLNDKLKSVRFWWGKELPH